MRWARILALVLILGGFSPLIGLALVAALSALTGCRVHAGAPVPCVIAGVDLGGMLYSLGVGGWAFFLTAPAALAGIALALVLAVMALLRRARG